MDIIQELVKKGVLPKSKVTAVRDEAETSGITIEESLLKHGVTSRDILSAKGEYFDVPTKSLDGVAIPSKVLDLIPQDSVLRYRFIPISVTDGVLEVGMVDPDDIEARDV